jgi:basic amino acid/polyamine antiporter, APA family
MTSQDSLQPLPVAGRPLRRILGQGFGVAVIFGGMVGVGILRLPGVIAGQVGTAWLILAVWVAGALYALLGAVNLAEVATALPQAGGFYIYARRAFGPMPGFVQGWADWLDNCAVIAYGAVTASNYAGALMPALAAWPRVVALSILVAFLALHLAGLPLSSRVQQVASSVTAVTFLVLAVACFVHGGATTGSVKANAPVLTAAALVVAFRAIVVTYDGWYEAIYFAEEDIDAARHLPRAMIGGLLLVLLLYLVMNLAFLRVFSIPTLAASTLPAADAARLVFPAWGSSFVTLLALLTLLSLVNAVLLGAPRILLAIGRDGLFSERAARVEWGGTPVGAMVFTAGAAALLIASSHFDEILAVAAVLVTATYAVNYAAVITLRLREPGLQRPFRAWGYPVTTLLALAGSLVFLLASIHDDPASAARTVVLLAAALPIYGFMQWRKARHMAV